VIRVWLFGAGLSLAACSSNEGSQGSGGSGGIIVAPDASAGEGGHSHGGGGGGDEPLPFTGPENLALTGLYADFAKQTLAPGLIAYDVRFPLWHDGAAKTRWLQLPPGTQIDTSWMDVWQFPVGTKAWMELSFGGKKIETRFSHKREDGWMMVSYLWNEAGTDATAVPLGAENVLGTELHVPSMQDCTNCHGAVGDGLWGVGAIQLSNDTGDGWLSKLAAQGLLSNPPEEEFPIPGEGVVAQTLGYLHSNCGQCHNNQHELASIRKLRLKLLISQKMPEETGLYTTTFGTTMSHIVDGTTVAVVPGKPAESQLWQRMNRREDLMGMPGIATMKVDAEAVQFVGEWISSLPAQ
jgi:hypothetical protein